jgi:dihydropteroate synthase
MNASPAPLLWRCRDRVLVAGPRPLIMGILNVTPDSFSDGGRYADPAAAVERGLAMLREGADVIDVGGESTRPGAAPVPAAEELARVAPVIEGLRRRAGDTAVLSIDTRKAAVAEQAVALGARLINDVSALTGDPAMAALARRTGAGVILMHMRGEPATMQQDPQYGDVVREVADFLRARLAALAADGLDPQTLAVDPGIGFGKTVAHNLRLLAGLPALVRLGRPVVVGLSRKRFLGTLTGREVGERMAASVAGLAYAAERGAHVLRVHDVRESCDAARLLEALRREEDGRA